MGKINYGKVILGGLVAAVVSYLLVGFVFGSILMPMWEAGMKSGIIRMPSSKMATVHILTNLILGIVAVYTYAAIRPRFGAGVKTALYAGILVAILKDIGPGITHAVWYTEPRPSVLLMTGLMAVATVISTFVGAWIYKE